MAKNPVKLLKDSSNRYPEEANLTVLRHPNLEGDERFSVLKSILLQFIKDRRKPPEQQSMHRKMTMRWKENLYSSLQRLLSELSHTHDAEIQEKLLSKVYSWFSHKATEFPPLSCPPKTEKKRAETPEPSPRRSRMPVLSSTVVDRLNLRYLECRKRENVAFQTQRSKDFMISSWQRMKARISGERARKMEQAKPKTLKSQRYLLNCEDFAENVHDFSKDYPDSPTSPKSDIDDDNTFVTKIGFFRHIHQKLIDVEVKPQALPRNINSSTLSIYSTPDKHSENRSFERSKSPLRRQMYDEVIASKNKLAQKKIACSVQNLQNGLILPEVPAANTRMPKVFPKGNEKLMSNPFLAKKKTKKSKKSKKGKKKGKK